jgi:hypothetical protein
VFYCRDGTVLESQTFDSRLLIHEFTLTDNSGDQLRRRFVCLYEYTVPVCNPGLTPQRLESFLIENFGGQLRWRFLCLYEYTVPVCNPGLTPQRLESFLIENRLRQM